MEREAGKSEWFREIDDLLGSLFVRILRGERVVELVLNRKAGNTVVLHGLSPAQRNLLGSSYDVAAQQSRGAWYLPEEVTLRVGVASWPYNFRTYTRFATNITLEERGSVQLADNPAAVLVWSILEPLCSSLFLPLDLRGPRTATRSREEQLQSWAEIDRFLGAVGFSVGEELAVMRYGGGWHKLWADAQLEAKLRLLAALSAQAQQGMGSLYRSYRTQELLAQYYKKAKGGQAKRTQALTKGLERTLSGFFAGDWLAFLNYMGEEPHPDEQVVKALPTPRLYATGASRAAETAAKLGISSEEAVRIAAVYWGEGGKTPIERRVDVLTRFWQLFDEIHSRQQPGMKPLWGLLEDYTSLDLRETPIQSPYQPGLYRELLPNELIQQIEQLWGTTMLQRWPEVIVTQPFPHFAMAEAFGPALRFWHGVALTSWFLCEGPYSRTDMAGLAEYHASHITALKEMGMPVDEHMFRDLINAEKRLGPQESIVDKQDTIDGGYGISITFTMSHGSRRNGFEKLRDIITHYRRAWVSEYLEKYLRALWELELKEAHKAYSVALHDRGKAPTVKQFARAALVPANHWFGGDISGLYAAIGEKCQIEPKRRALMPPDLKTFAHAVLQELRARARGSSPNPPLRPEDNRFENMAGMCLTYVQLEEALGKAPRRQEFTSLNNEYYWTVLADTLDDAVGIYVSAIEAAKGQLSSTQQPVFNTTHPTGNRPTVAQEPTGEKSEQIAPEVSSGQAALQQPSQGYTETHIAQHGVSGEMEQRSQVSKMTLLDRILRRKK
jgi:hypothetical protein